MADNRSIRLGEIPTALIYGPTKIGKTASIVRWLGSKCFYICTERGALIPALNPMFNKTLRTSKPWIPQLGRDYVECLSEDDPCGEINAVIDKLEPHLGTRYAAVALDTLSELADRDFTWGCKPRNEGGGSWGMKYGDHYRTLYGRINHIIRRLMAHRVIVVMTAHEQGPSAIEGKWKPGGAKLPGRLVESTPALFDMVLRCGADVGSDGSNRDVFRCDRLDREYVTGERFGVLDSVEPMDLANVMTRALLVAAGKWAEAEKLKPVAETSGSGGDAPPA